MPLSGQEVDSLSNQLEDDVEEVPVAEALLTIVEATRRLAASLGAAETDIKTSNLGGCRRRCAPNGWPAL